MDHSNEPNGESRGESRAEPRAESRVHRGDYAGLESLRDLFDQMKEMRDLVRSLQKNTKKDESKWVEEIMYNGLNLLDIWASQQNKYVTALMEALFTPEEMDKAYIKEGEHQSTRTNLDPERIKLLKRAFYLSLFFSLNLPMPYDFSFQFEVAFVNKYQLKNEKKAWRFIKKVANKNVMIHQESLEKQLIVKKLWVKQKVILMNNQVKFIK
jgi:hypothetical protein